VAGGSGIMTVNSPSGSRPTLQCDTRLWDDMAYGSGIMTVNSPSGSTLQCDMQLGDHDIEFARWQYSAMWQVALG